MVDQPGPSLEPAEYTTSSEPGLDLSQARLASPQRTILDGGVAQKPPLTGGGDLRAASPSAVGEHSNLLAQACRNPESPAAHEDGDSFEQTIDLSLSSADKSSKDVEQTENRVFKNVSDQCEGGDSYDSSGRDERPRLDRVVPPTSPVASSTSPQVMTPHHLSGKTSQSPLISHTPYTCDPPPRTPPPGGDSEPPQHPIRFPIPRPLPGAAAVAGSEYEPLQHNPNLSPTTTNPSSSSPAHPLNPSSSSPNHPMNPSSSSLNPSSSSPAHPLNLHQSPAHPAPSPTSDTPFQRTPYHPPPESGGAGALDSSPQHHLGAGLQYPGYPPYSHPSHYFNNANSYTSNFMASHAAATFQHNFSSAEVRSMMGSHEMYMTAQQQRSSIHDSSSPSLKTEYGGLTSGQSPRPQDPYSFNSASDEDGCSPNRTPAPHHYPMGFPSMPMPLLAAPKPKKPRKPRKARSPKPPASLPPDGQMSNMQVKEEDSRR